MLGLGTWEFQENTMFYRGRVLLVLADKDGEYDVTLDLPGVDVPDFEIVNMAQDGNTIAGAVKTSLLKGKEIPFSVTFDGDTANGFMKIPFMGKITMKDGKRIA